jgi:hypothetical protein
VLAGVAWLVTQAVAPTASLSMGGPLLDGTIDPADLSAVVPAALLRPELLGDVLERLQQPEARRRRGAFFTPVDSAAHVVARTTDGWAWPVRPVVCDPACGGGAFLLAAARALHARGIDRGEIVQDLLWGMDTDPLAVAVTQATLALWASSGTGPAPGHVRQGDALTDSLDTWARADGFDLVVGNPPFQSQLATRTARTRDQALAMAERFGAVSRGYADSATLFLVAASSLTRPHGRFSLILPESFLAARDAAPARRAVVRDAALIGLWLPGAPLFAASVRVCIPVFEVGRRADAQEVRRWRGVEAEEVAPLRPDPALSTAQTWSPLAADLLGIPDAQLDVRNHIGTSATATAGFRDQFYGLRPFVRPADAIGPIDVPLITSGAIDLANNRWGRRVTRFAGTSITRPVVDVEGLRDGDPTLARWAERVLVPKLLVATQTRVIEVIVDEVGNMWPSVPVIAVVAAPEQLWPLAAALASPPVSADSLRHHAGSALSGDAIKLSAKQILETGLPAESSAWEQGTECLRAASDAAVGGDASTWRAQLQRFGMHMCEAYGVDRDVFAWWLARVPPFR